jgi:hypothetical protein
MRAQKEREYVKGVYPWPGWSEKVDAMEDDQVIAIYIRLKNAEPFIEEAETNNQPDQMRLF